MLYFSSAKTLLIAAVCALGVLLSLPNLAPKPAFLPSFFPWNQVHLGLDLRGGSYLLLQIDLSTVEKQDLASLVDQTRQTMRAAGLGYVGLHADLANHQVVLHLLNTSDLPAAQAALGKLVNFGTNNVQNLNVTVGADGAVALAIPKPRGRRGNPRRLTSRSPSSSAGLMVRAC
jgi:preprotein translocase subunit SecD/SecD/SecF fusion protein